MKDQRGILRWHEICSGPVSLGLYAPRSCPRRPPISGPRQNSMRTENSNWHCHTGSLDGSCSVSSNRSRRQVRPNLEAQRWCSLRTKRTTRGVLQGCWGRGLKCRPLPQTPSPAKRCKNAFTKAEAVSKKTVPSEGFTPLRASNWRPKLRLLGRILGVDEL